MIHRFLNSIHEIDANDWNRLCGTDYPFLRHEFFSALEDSGSTTKTTGWQPYHLVIEKNNLPIAIMPLFLKHHSYGEYIFDWSWADAWHQNGLEYYPKFLNAIPFTPAFGPRWGIVSATETSQKKVLAQCFLAIEAEAKRLNLSSCHWLFNPIESNPIFSGQGYLQRICCQYHWLNKSYQSFEHFLSTFNARKRKSLKRERRLVTEQGIILSIKEGNDISKEEWQQFYHFYQLTYLKRSGHLGYLSETFFPLLAKNLNKHLVMAQAHIDNNMIAAALYFKDSQTLYGRYWGCAQEYDQLHFETCYYQGIEYAIDRGLQRFDPGAQGEHKIQRGFTPIITYSHHWIREPAFAKAIKKFLIAETKNIQDYQIVASERLPFKTPNQ